MTNELIALVSQFSIVDSYPIGARYDQLGILNLIRFSPKWD